MKVLGIETSTSVCGVALAEDGQVLCEAFAEEGNVHSERLLLLIDAACRLAGCTVRDLAGIAVSIGPGSFTGLRIGLSVAKGLAFATGSPLVPVETLRAVALEAADDPSTREVMTILASIDARREEVYHQLFRRTRDGLVSDTEARDSQVDELRRGLEGMEVLLAGTGAQKVARALSPATRWVLARGAHGGVSASRVALEGARQLARGEIADAASLEPRYIKEFFLARHH